MCIRDSLNPKYDFLCHDYQTCNKNKLTKEEPLHNKILIGLHSMLKNEIRLKKMFRHAEYWHTVHSQNTIKQ